jgi:hypothetical protein
MQDLSPNNPAGCQDRFSFDLNDSRIWNINEFIKFLVDNQGRVIDIEIPEGVALDSIGIYDLLDLFSFKSVTIRTFNLVQQPHPVYKLNFHPLAFKYFNVSPNTDYSQYHTWSGKYTFGAFYNRPTWSRIGLASHLHSYHSGKTMLNFRYNPGDADSRNMFELDQLFQIDPNSLEYFGQLIPALPLQVEAVDGYTIDVSTKEHTEQLSEFYRDFLIDIVSETFVRGRCFYPTEKTVRPMLMKKPFIHMGPKCFLIHLRQMGFQTFNDFWSEDYDGHSMDQRYKYIIKLINNLSLKSADELQDMYYRMQPILDHNYQLLLTKQFTREITYVE